MATQTNQIKQMLSKLPQLTDTEFGEGVSFPDGALVWSDSVDSLGDLRSGIYDVCDDGEGAFWLSPICPETTEAAVWDALCVAADLRRAIENLLAAGHINHAQIEEALKEAPILP